MPRSTERTRARLLTGLLAAVSGLGVMGWGVTGSAGPQTCLTRCAVPDVVVERPPSLDLTPLAGASAARRAAFPTVPDVTTLHSRPGSAHTIFLDFDGADLARTQWATLQATTTSSVATAADLDGAPGRGSAELATIELVWREVAEDFAPFDVDVTTQQPSADALSRSGDGDPTYGTTVVFASDNWVRRWCGGCTGASYADVYGGSATDPWRTALVFPDVLVRQAAGLPVEVVARILGTTASHEVGHQLGLSHDGLTGASPLGATPYNPGNRPWGPIMGATANPLTRWAGPAAPYTNNREDDLAVIGRQLGLVPDETPLLPLLPGARTRGVISTTTDQDTYTIVPVRKTVVTVGPEGSWGNLDVALEVADASGRHSTVAPAAKEVSGRLTGLDASVTLSPGVAYTLTVRADTAPGLGGYGSVGRYAITLS